MSLKGRLETASFGGLWLFAAVALLSIAAQNILFLGLGAWLALGFMDKGGSLRPHPALRLAWPFLLWALLASWMSENRGHSLDTWKRWGLMLAAWYAAGALKGGRRPLKAVLGALLFFSGLWCLGASLWSLRGPASAFASGEALSSLLGRWSEEGAWRAVSGSGGYMVLGSCSMLMLSFFTGLLLEDASWRRPLAWACMAAMALALLLTQTRSAWIGAAAGVGALLIFRRPGLALGAAVLLALALIFPGSPLRSRLAQGLDMSQDSTRERVYMAEAGLGIIDDHPWLGVGDAMESFNGKEGYYRRYMPAEAKHWDSTRESDPGHLHNDLIQVAAMYGVPALLLLLAFMARLAWEARLALKSPEALVRGLGLGMLGALLAWWVNGLFEFNFGSFQSSFNFWFLAGLFLATRGLNAGEAA